MIVRELLTKFGFKADTAAVERFSATIDKSKEAAGRAAKAVRDMASATQAAARVAKEGSAATAEATNKTAASFARMGEGAKGSVDAIRRAMEQLPKELRAIDQQALAFGKDFDSAKAKVEALSAAIRRLTMEGVSAANPHLQGLSAELATIKASMAHGEGKHGGAFGGLGHHLALLGAGYASFQAGERGVEHFAEFQQSMQKAGAAMMASAEQVAEMTKRALEVSGELGFTARQSAEGLIELGSAGFEAEHAMKMLPTSLKLARAGMIDPKLATELLASTLRGFYGNDSSKSGHVGDVLARVHDVGGVKMPALLESMKYIAPAAKAMGQSLEDIGTMTALLGRFGMSGSMAGNALKSMLVKLAAPSSMGSQKLSEAGMGGEVTGAKGKHAKKVHESMVKAFGLNVADAKGNMLPMVEVFHQMVAKMAKSKMGNIQKATILKDMFGLEDVPQAMAMMTAMAEKGGAAFEEVSHKIHNTNGALDRMNSIMQQGLAPAWQRLNAKGEVLADMLIAGLAPAMTGVLDAASAVIDGAVDLVKWFDEVSDHGESLRGYAKALRAALLIMAPAATVIGLKAIAGVIEATVIPAIRRAAAASLLFFRTNAMLIILGTTVVAFGLLLQDLYTYLQGGDSLLGPWYDSISGFINQLYEAGGVFIDWLQEVAPSLVSFFAHPLETTKGLLGDFVIWAFGLPDLILSAWSVVTAIAGFFKDGFDAAVEVVQPFIDWLMTELAGMWEVFSALIAGDPTAAWNAFVELLKSSFLMAKDFILESLGAIIAAFAGDLGVTLPGYLLNIPAMFDDAFKAAYDFVATWIGKAADAVEGLATSIGDALNLVPGLHSSIANAGGSWATPGSDSAAKAGSNQSSVTIGDTHIDVHVPAGAPPTETGRQVASSHGQMLNRHAADAARIQPRQLR